MPGKFTDKNGGNMAGHSDKWSNHNRRSNSHDAGQGSRGSRNMGTGLAGKQNTIASKGVDTSKMKPEEKLKYFKSLGIMPGVKPEPEETIAPPALNKVQALTQDLQKVFAQHPHHINSIVKHLKEIPPAQFKKAVFAAYRAIQESTSQKNINPDQVLQYIHDAIDNSTIE